MVHPRVSSLAAGTKSQKQRAVLLESIREEVSGNEAAAALQMAIELKLKPKEERQKILKQAGFSLGEEPSVGQALSMKVDVGLPWNKLRILRRSELFKFAISK